MFQFRAHLFFGNAAQHFCALLREYERDYKYIDPGYVREIHI